IGNRNRQGREGRPEQHKPQELMRDHLEAPQYGGEPADITQGWNQLHCAPINVAFKIIATSEPCWRSIRGFQGHCAEESNASRPRSAWQSATRLSRRPGESDRKSVV